MILLENGSLPEGSEDDQRSVSECWPWGGACNGGGYGVFYRPRGSLRQSQYGLVLAHRMAYELANELPPGDAYVLHSCDNPPCCNPAHLRLGTQADNMADRWQKQKGRQAIYEAKFAEAAVTRIQKLAAVDQQETGRCMYDGMNWDEIPIIAIDTETTGFRKEDRIVELGMVMLRGDEILDTYHTFLNPGMPMPEGASSINGITDETLRDAPRFIDVRCEVMDWLCRGAPWVAHNAQFDMRMLSYELPPEKWPKGIPTLCTLDKARSRGFRPAKLSDLAARYSIRQEEAHTALDDARVCGIVARRLTRGLPITDYYTRLSEQWV